MYVQLYYTYLFNNKEQLTFLATGSNIASFTFAKAACLFAFNCIGFDATAFKNATGTKEPRGTQFATFFSFEAGRAATFARGDVTVGVVFTLALL